MTLPYGTYDTYGKNYTYENLRKGIAITMPA